MIPKQWHIYIVDLEPPLKSKPGKQRPCLAIQPSELAAFGHPSTVVLPLTTQVSSDDAFPLRVRISKGVCSLTKDSEVLVDQILAWDNSFFKEDLGKIPEALVGQVQKALIDFLDL